MTDQDSKPGPSPLKWAAVGAVVGIPLPFVGPLVGAAAGAGFAYLKGKKKT